MHQKLHFLQGQIRLDSRFFWSLLGAESIILSLLHHRLNFWGWPDDKQVLVIFVVAPAFAFILDRLVSPLWPALAAIPRPRWMLFLIPAACISGLIAWHFLVMPEAGHRLEIVPAGNVQLRELRAAYGNAVPLSTFTNMPGWKLQGGLLVSQSVQPAPLEYTFYGPINEQVRVSFVVSQPGGQAQVTLDARQAGVNLSGADGDERRARLGTAYRWGFLNFLIVPLILTIDLLTALMLLTILWVMQEVTQDRAGHLEESGGERFLSHAQGLLIVCALALLLHAINFLSVPLAVLKDSPSYLQGVVYWLQHHSLDGVSSYRGPGTTLLFMPAMVMFGRNPLGLKLLLHLLAFGCVPLSYRLGWQLGRRRWFAFAAGLLTALLPDLYAYSSYVLSEAPHAFFGLLFCTLLLSALETMSFGGILAALVSGSFDVLVRSENLILLALGAALILVKIAWLGARSYRADGGPTIPLWQYAVCILAAALPLLVWSEHNQRVYGFFGLSDFAGAALYDGWIYFGENSRISITDHASPAVHAIDEANVSSGSAGVEAQTSWTVYYILLKHGYASEQAFSLLQKATLDSIRKDLRLSWKLLLVKLGQGFEPHPFIPATFLMPGEHPTSDTLNSDYFDEERIFIPPLIDLQHWINNAIGQYYGSVFTAWFWLGLVMLFICIYRRPFFLWASLALIALNSILLPTIISMSMWRYVFLGLILMQYPLLSGLQSAGRFGFYYLQVSGIRGFPLKRLSPP